MPGTERFYEVVTGPVTSWRLLVIYCWLLQSKSRIQEFGPAGLFSNEQNSTELRVQTTYLIIGGLHFSYFFYWRRKLFPASYFISISLPHFLDVCTRCIKKYERACQDQYVT